jgi:hypothetical protein
LASSLCGCWWRFVVENCEKEIVMHLIKKSGLLVAVVSTALVCSVGSASADEIESSGVHIPNAAAGSGHVLVSLVSSTARFVEGTGQVDCSTVGGEGTITRETVPNLATTEIGNIESLTFADGANPECDSTFFGVTSCRITFNGLPIMISYRENAGSFFDEVVMSNIETTFTCETIVGTINCHYTAATIDGDISPLAIRNSFVFNEPLSGEASNSFICPGSNNFVASLKLNREASAGGGRIMITD